MTTSERPDLPELPPREGPCGVRISAVEEDEVVEVIERWQPTRIRSSCTAGCPSALAAGHSVENLPQDDGNLNQRDLIHAPDDLTESSRRAR